MSPVVIDASAGVELSLQTPLGRRLQAQLPTGATMWAPEHYFTEVVAVLRRHELAQRFSTARVQIALDRVLSAPLRRVSVRPLVPDAWRHRHNLTVADALYVVVAEHLDAPLLTTDQRLANTPGLSITTITP